MAEIKKYLDLTALGTLVDQIKAEDDKVKAYADTQIEKASSNYDAAGSATTALADAKAYTDELANGQVATNKANIETIQSDYLKAADKTALQDAINAVDVIADKNAEDIAAINDTDNGILAQAKSYTDTEVGEVQGNVDTLSSYVGTFTHGTATTVVEYINAKTDGIATSGNLEALGNRVTAVESGVAAIQADYLTSTDKTELEGEIANVQTAVETEKSRAEGIESGLDTRIKAIENDYLKVADKTELSDAITAEKERAEGVESGLDTRVKAIEDDYLTSTDKESLQTQINTILNNPDTEGVINSINEFTQYIADHGEVAEGFRTDIDQNKTDIEALEDALDDYKTLVGETYATKTELANEKKALQEEIDADVKVVADQVTTLEGSIATKVEQSIYEAKVAELEDIDTGLADRITALEAKHGDGEGTVESLIATAKQEAIDAAALDAANKDAVVLAESQKYIDAEIDKVEATLDTLQGAVDTKAEQSEVNTISGKVSALETDMTQAKTDIDAVEALAAANKAAHEANAAAIALKASQTDLDAAVSRIAANESAISTINTALADKAEQDDLDAAIDRIAANETAIAANTSAINSFTPITSDEITAMFA